LNVLTKIGSALLLSGAAVAPAYAVEEFRWVCPEADTCGISSASIAGGIAVTTAIETNAAVGDTILLISYRIVSGGNAQKVRTYTVNSTPVTSTANLNDYGYVIDVHDGAAPSKPKLSNDGVFLGPWFTWWLQSGQIYALYCTGRLNCY
jgi:hypothetical protein